MKCFLREGACMLGDSVVVGKESMEVELMSHIYHLAKAAFLLEGKQLTPAAASL